MASKLCLFFFNSFTSLWNFLIKLLKASHLASLYLWVICIFTLSSFIKSLPCFLGGLQKSKSVQKPLKSEKLFLVFFMFFNAKGLLIPSGFRFMAWLRFYALLCFLPCWRLNCGIIFSKINGWNFERRQHKHKNELNLIVWNVFLSFIQSAFHWSEFYFYEEMSSVGSRVVMKWGEGKSLSISLFVSCTDIKVQ